MCSLFVLVSEFSVHLPSCSLIILSPVESSNKPVEGILHFCYRVDLSQFFFLRVCISLLTLPICSRMLSIFPISSLNILIIIIINSLCDSYGICVMFESGFLPAWSLQTVLFLAFWPTL